MNRLFVGLGALNGFLGVALGAFGAHALRGKLGPGLAEVWQTAVLYHLVHAIGLAGLDSCIYGRILVYVGGTPLLASILFMVYRIFGDLRKKAV